ncbi:hypothetical protein T07_12245 [Trichinella nelsoni]|uniref:Uncharacterized protein n=1 Tax=Trichinella nelsoni TaxID=6336 RepID=A0A0V0RMW4_9BILA|nr:hypothetical protein T07_12245 [Trichinella nelsoni]
MAQKRCISIQQHCSSPELVKNTATTQRNEKLVLYLFTRNRMQIFERCLDVCLLCSYSLPQA